MAHFRTEEDMFPLVAQWQESGETQKAFCIQRSIPVSVFAYWLRRYRDQQGGSGDQVPGFVPIRTAVSDSVYPYGETDLINSRVRHYL
ncbi:IS66 family insertion sequence element accessory protein TnpA [Tunicatimonas pelagia]|uniref:IS66 family insertion sequence element accessory protein TnpA n=1 Tax=Tunicatimonas pelagia TaxID=931531 RepID=UPI0026661A81|nr:hypothetical protein [Tunicatimonas pelagia]WKN46220.1 hypothetical protein P0M28_14805 [Tunicatimonas pelagia]